MVNTRTGRRLAIVAVLLTAMLWYLRDPAWVARQTTGMWDWEEDSAGPRYRWASSHASFFVPSDAAEARFRVATTFDEHGSQPLLVTISVDDIHTARLVLTDAAWHDVIVTLPPRGSRRERRIDVRTNGAREDNRAIRISEPQVSDASR